MALEQHGAEGLGVREHLHHARGQRDGCHRAEHLCRRQVSGRDCCRHHITTGNCEGAVAFPEFVPPSGVERSHELDGEGHCQVGAGIGGAGPVEHEMESTAVGAGAVPAVAHHGRGQLGAQ